MLTKRLEEIAARKAELRAEVDNADEARLAEIEAEAERLAAEEAEIRRKLSIAEKLSFEAQTSVESPERRAFFDILRRGATTTGTAGAVVPTFIADEIVETLQKESALLSRVSVYQVPGRFTVPVVEAGEGETKAEGENAVARTLTTRSVTLNGYEVVYLVPTSAAVEAMSTAAFERYILDAVSRALVTGIERLVVNGGGPSAVPPTLTGLLKPLNDGVAKHVVNYTGALTYDNIVTALGELGSMYHTNAAFVMSRKTYFSRVAAIKDDTKRPIVYQDVQTAPSWSILGYPVVFSDFVPDGVVVVGDLRKYAVNFSAPMRIDVSEHYGFGAGLRTYRALAVVDGAPVDQDAFVYIAPAPSTV
ncbi:MAG: phage major capsid protein [Hydrogenibacillus schlegelii]|nr:phage major capsid protein [Hydrogenibacillus schlegelii]